jgi:hypothetical protein
MIRNAAYPRGARSQGFPHCPQYSIPPRTDCTTSPSATPGARILPALRALLVCRARARSARRGGIGNVSPARRLAGPGNVGRPSHTRGASTRTCEVAYLTAVFRPAARRRPTPAPRAGFRATLDKRPSAAIYFVGTAKYERVTERPPRRWWRPPRPLRRADPRCAPGVAGGSGAGRIDPTKAARDRGWSSAFHVAVLLDPAGERVI